MSAIDGLFDRYGLMARQRPAFLMLFPIVVAAIVLFPALQTWWATLLSAAGGCGVALALAEFAQAAGARRQAGLFDAWGGSPSEAMLRQKDPRLDDASRQRYRSFLEGHVAGLSFPSAAKEAKTPALVDAPCASASRWLRSQTRDKKKFALLFRQNVSYGFRRNSLGLRNYGITVSVIALAAIICGAAVSGSGLNGSALAVAAVIAIAMLYFWIVIVRPGWVKIAAEAYAAELLAACDVLV
jgi:hypothetical protein